MSQERQYMLNIRLTREEWEELQAAVDQANDRAEGVGLPRDISKSALVRLWIRDRLEDGATVAKEPESPTTRQQKPATDLNRALAKLRGLGS